MGIKITIDIGLACYSQQNTPPAVTETDGDAVNPDDSPMLNPDDSQTINPGDPPA
jgi:hypothetical protein